MTRDELLALRDAIDTRDAVEARGAGAGPYATAVALTAEKSAHGPNLEPGRARAGPKP
jgi:hypothetical protein